MDADFYQTVLKAMRMVRSDIFGVIDGQMPVSEPEDAHIPQIGFVGPDYRPGGTILFGINPGGGGDTYVRTAEDALLLPMIKRLRDGGASSEAVRGIFNQYAANMQTWNLWRIVAPVLVACGIRQSEVAYLNWCPFRTRGDQMPHAHAMRRARDAHLLPLCRNLAPSRTIALGKKVGTWLEKAPPSEATLYVIPRTIGDSYLSTEALGVLDELKQSSGRPGSHV